MDRLETRLSRRRLIAFRVCFVLSLVAVGVCVACVVVLAAARTDNGEVQPPPQNHDRRSLPDASSNTSTVRKGPGGPWPDGEYTFYCGNFHTSAPVDIRTSVDSLQSDNASFTVPANGCVRVFCHDTSAVYACTDKQEPKVVCGYDIGWMVARMEALCCDQIHGLSAQLFDPANGWNAVVAYGNCAHADDEQPSVYGDSDGGINGYCLSLGS